MSRPHRVLRCVSHSTQQIYPTSAAGPSTITLSRRPPSSWPRPFSSSSLHLATPPRDAEIPFNLVQLVSPDDNSLSEPQNLRRLLSRCDLTTHSLILVASNPPVVKLVDKTAEAHRAREAGVRDSLRRRTASEDKEVQVHWGSASGDLAHKLALARSMLERGDRVRLVFAPKQGEKKDKTNAEMKQGIMQSFERPLEEVGKRSREDAVKGKMVICYWDPEGKVKEEVKAKIIEGEVEKRKEKEEKREARRRKDEERRQAAEERKRQEG